MEKANDTPLQNGIETIRGYSQDLPSTPGVYRMISEGGDVLYVGKAKNLKKRVSSYCNTGKLSVRIQRMIAQTRMMEFVHTHTEVEALLLESNLIKKLKPRYNILLRDDKSFPYILITGDHDYPLLTKHRGSKKRKGEYFGPFAGAGDVNRTVKALQKAFLLRNCSDNVFANRSRPCLQYHIKRCTAPCVGYVSKDDYAEQVDQARRFLNGRRDVQDDLLKKMESASDNQEYEKAAKYRDRIKALTSIQAKQDINVRGVRDADVIAIHQKGGKSCIQVFFFRMGQSYGNRAYYPRHDKDEDGAVVLGAFVAQFYENKPVPRDIYLNHDLSDAVLLEEALQSRSKFKITINNPKRGDKRKLLAWAEQNAEIALTRHLDQNAQEQELLDGVAELFELDQSLRRIEVYDNSHISGTNMVGAMIVSGQGGFIKNAYRKFNIRTAEVGDDYGMMREVMQRRFRGGYKDEQDPNSPQWPDLLLIDGGQGQFNVVMEELCVLGIDDKLQVVAIAKGPERNAGREQFFMEGRDPFQLPINDPVLHYLQRLRDEAHRFAIGAHRQRRTKDISRSKLDDIPGVGAKKKKALLHHFGSAEAVRMAGIEDLCKVEGINIKLAEQIYNYFH